MNQDDVPGIKFIKSRKYGFAEWLSSNNNATCAEIHKNIVANIDSCNVDLYDPETIPNPQ